MVCTDFQVFSPYYGFAITWFSTLLIALFGYPRSRWYRSMNPVEVEIPIMWLYVTIYFLECGGLFILLFLTIATQCWQISVVMGILVAVNWIICIIFYITDLRPFVMKCGWNIIIAISFIMTIAVNSVFMAFLILWNTSNNFIPTFIKPYTNLDFIFGLTFSGIIMIAAVTLLIYRLFTWSIYKREWNTIYQLYTDPPNSIKVKSLII